MNWRHVLLGLAVYCVRQMFGPLGGIFFLSFDARLDPVAMLLRGEWIPDVVIVYCVLVADEAFNDGVPALRAYGLAVLALATLAPFVRWNLAPLMGWFGTRAPSMLFGVLSLLLQGGLAVSVYGYWRVTRRAMREAEAAETERTRNEQRVQTARLLALQSRVEPQMLFDALGRIGKLHVREPQAADAMLTDLIALLRAMLPGAKADNSKVEREFALVEAWLRVTRNAAAGATDVKLRIAPGAESIGVAPMLVLPLLRTVLALPDAARCEWALSAEVAGDRLTVTLQASPEAPPESSERLASAELSSLHERLTQLFGSFASLTVRDRPPAFTLDLPRLQDESEEDRS